VRLWVGIIGRFGVTIQRLVIRDEVVIRNEGLRAGARSVMRVESWLLVPVLKG